ncbi:hypothetical protein LCGC14_0593090 [marine sediment metagenome]|uniref:HNH domain-containing protein n=1 Tax=marine sediment metagenome TaxID=412755 RepID=A0A0F9TZ00_9ZZZZ
MPRKLPKGHASRNALVRRYKYSAKRRNLEFDLSLGDCEKLFGNVCYYCGSNPQQIITQKNYNGYFEYNGIDRVNNAKGYTVENVVTCCVKCNSMKRDMVLHEFLKHVEKISNYRMEA